MQAEIISIGDELTSGQRLDTNAQWLSQQLSDLGISTVRHTTVGDNLADNVDALSSAAQRADYVICTGGLGPTLDDLTRQALADAFDRRLFLDSPSLERIREMFQRRGREMPPQNRLQAMFPEGSQIIPNPHGSAPGVDLIVSVNDKQRRLFALPGVPAEMKQMWRETVVPRLDQELGSSLGRLRFHTLKLFGIGESDVEVKLPRLIDRKRIPTVGITVSRATISLRIASRAHSDEEFKSLIDPTIREIESALGELIFGEGDDELEHAVLRQLASQSLTLATVEVGAASWIGDWMLKASDQKQHLYLGSIAIPGLELAERWLADAPTGSAGTPGHSTGADQTIWEILARQVRSRFSADIGLAVGSYPTAAQMQIADAPFDCMVAIAFADRVFLQLKRMGGHPDVLGPRMAKTGLDSLRQALNTACAVR